MTTVLEFLPNPAEEEEGLGNAGIEMFRSQPYASAAREVGQNSRDAAAHLPVRISFDRLELPFEDVPTLDQLRSVVDLCLRQSRQAQEKKETAFFEQAQKVLASGPLKVLRIADENTTGVRGPSEPGTPFHSLLKGSGKSKKDSETSGGSYGIGKNAAYAISDIQTVFYSTVWFDANHRRHFLAQGKSILISHRDAARRPRRQFGYWGAPNFQPLRNQADAPEWLRRSEPGTSVFAMGFRDSPDWQKSIACSLAQNFFYAIHQGEMEFSIDGGNIQISRLTLDSVFADPQIRAVARAADREGDFDLSVDLYRCLVSPEAQERIASLPGLGNVRIRVLVGEGLPKKVCIIRNGMVITDNLQHFGDKFAKFPMYRDFVALVVPLDDEGRTLIKTLENPNHDELSSERLPDPDRREYAKGVMKRLAKTIRETIRSYTLTAFADEVAADELRKFFEDLGSVPPQEGSTGPDDPESVRYKIEPRKIRRRQKAQIPGGGGVGGVIHPPGPGPSPGPGPGPGPNPPGQRPATPITLSSVRNVLRPAQNAKTRRIFLTSPKTGMADIAIEATGLNQSEDLIVMKASDSVVVRGGIRRRLVAGERTQFDVEFSEAYAGPIELRVSIEPEQGAAE